MGNLKRIIFYHGYTRSMGTTETLLYRLRYLCCSWNFTVHLHANVRWSYFERQGHGLSKQIACMRTLNTCRLHDVVNVGNHLRQSTLSNAPSRIRSWFRMNGVQGKEKLVS